MKNFLFIFLCIAGMLFSSCSEVYIYNDRQQLTYTTAEIQELASKDTVTYKLVKQNNVFYVVNTKTNLVNLYASKTEGIVVVFFNFLFLVIALLLIRLLVILFSKP